MVVALLRTTARQPARRFTRRLVRAGRPKAKRNFLSDQHLIDAYRHAENQDWLGFVLAPKAIAKMAALELPVHERAFYRRVPQSYMHHPCADSIYGFAFDNGSVNGENLFRESIIAMKGNAGAAHAAKYDRTVEFLTANGWGCLRLATVNSLR